MSLSAPVPRGMVVVDTASGNVVATVGMQKWAVPKLLSYDLRSFAVAPSGRSDGRSQEQIE